MAPATYSEIVEFLRIYPAASPSWAEGLFAARLSLDVLEKFMATMNHDVGSPLRRAEEGLLANELLQLNRSRGEVYGSIASGGKFSCKVRVVLSATEQTRVSRLVQNFCQPYFDTSKRFGKNGHAVMNAVRRVLTAYGTTKVPVGGSVVEVGPDVSNWLLSPTPSQWAGERYGAYQAARPVLTPRDSVRVKWAELVDLVLRGRKQFFSDDVIAKAEFLQNGYEQLFKKKRIQEMVGAGEYILSYDSNYDIKFSDMPLTMALCGARAWYGTLVRAKGLTRETRMVEGKLELMGVNYRVDWKAGRIDFRHTECRAFGYSHDVWEYMKYEEHNGFVWTTEDCHYVYSKGPETNDEILFFQVVRVPKVHRMMEPRFVEHPKAGMMELTSLWAVGDEQNGVPTSFQKVCFHVDALNFSKVLEKRRALDHKGDLAVSVALVRSTNVRFWLHGTPVGVNQKIEAKLADATAVVVEALVAQRRLETNEAFHGAMYQYNLNLPRHGWFRRLLETVVDLKAASGAVIGPVARIWAGVRESVIDAAIRPLGEVRVGARLVEGYVKLPEVKEEVYDGIKTVPIKSVCSCSEIAELRAAMRIAKRDDKSLLQDYWNSCVDSGVCKYCSLDLEEVVNYKVVECDDDGVKEDGVDSGYESQSDVDIPPLVECGSSWKDNCNLQRVESRTMQEFVDLETYLGHCELVELRVDAMRIAKTGPVTDQMLAEFSTTRTKHNMLQFVGGRCVRRYGPDIGVVSGLYDVGKDKIVPVRTEGSVMYAVVSDGFYYTCNRLRIWNGPELIQAVEYAQAYGVVRDYRSMMNVTLGVPGAGKTYGMMEVVAKMIKEIGKDFLVLSVTKKSVEAAQVYGQSFGMGKECLDKRVMTLDSYLMHMRFPAKHVFVDEFPMVHIGKVDAALSIAGAQYVKMFGDARQIPYDSFCAEFTMENHSLRGTVAEGQVKFLPMTHRLNTDVCAMWLDQYPQIYPCSCCRVGERDNPTLEWVRVRSLDAYPYDSRIRYHTFKQDERDELKSLLGMRGDNVALRSMQCGGLSTVHEDQGSTHDKVVTVRLSVDYDKNASPRNPSLYNRDRYVLTDTTRHKEKYSYLTMCEEMDKVVQRIELSKDKDRLALVREHKGLGVVNVLDML